MTDEMMEPSSSETSDEPSEAYEEDDDALQEPGSETQALGDQPNGGSQVGGGDAGGHGAPRTRQEAEAALEYTSAYCRNCPIRERCVQEACAIYRAEAAAVAILRAPVVAGVPLRGSVL